MERSERRESRGNSGAVTPQHSPPSIRQSKPLSSSGETHCLENKGSLGPPHIRTTTSRRQASLMSFRGRSPALGPGPTLALEPIVASLNRGYGRTPPRQGLGAADANP